MASVEDRFVFGAGGSALHRHEEDRQLPELAVRQGVRALRQHRLLRPAEEQHEGLPGTPRVRRQLAHVDQLETEVPFVEHHREALADARLEVRGRQLFEGLRFGAHSRLPVPWRTMLPSVSTRHTSPE